MKRYVLSLLSVVFCMTFFVSSTAQASSDIQLKYRKQIEKNIRTKMPPQLILDHIRQVLKANEEKWGTQWNSFTIEDNEEKDEYVLVARAVSRKWAFSLVKQDCPKPALYNDYLNDVQKGGTPVDFAALVGVNRQRSWFRYIVKVYMPMAQDWRNPCIAWNLPPKAQSNLFYKENYNTKVYSENLGKLIYQELQKLEKWKAPKKAKKIPTIKGQGEELLVDGVEDLSDQERQLSIKEQEKLIEQRQKEKESKKNNAIKVNN